MPLKHGKSQKSFEHNIKAEMNAGKPQDQALAIAYDVKRRAKRKMAEGGNVSVPQQKRPMPDSRNNDAGEIRRNSAQAAPRQGDSQSGERAVAAKQSMKGMQTTRIKHPKMVPQSGYSTRMRDEEDDLQSSAHTGSAGEQPPERDNEMDAASSGNPLRKKYRDEQGNMSFAEGGSINNAEPFESAEEDNAEHPAGLEEDNDQMRPDESDYMSDHAQQLAEGGIVDPTDEELYPNREHHLEDDMDSQPEGEAKLERDDSIAAGTMARMGNARNKDNYGSEDYSQAVRYAHGGEITDSRDHDDILSHESIFADPDASQVDLSRNADEDANEEDHASFHALEKENYSESDGLRSLSQPDDSNTQSDSDEMNSHDQHDDIERIRSKMKKKQFPSSRE